jgi:hypothetical protein
MPKKVDLTGVRFGRLVVVKRLQAVRDGSILWECHCDCGNLVQASTRHLNRKKNYIRSCGCNQTYNRKGKEHPQWKGAGDISGHWWSQRIGREFSTNRAKLEVTITPEYIWDLFVRQEGRCALSGTSLQIHNNPKVNTASLDRIDSSQGYTPDNVQWVHKVVNMMKGTYDQQVFVDMCSAVAKHSATGACPIR